MPPLIVESLQTITHSRPATRPMPVMRPAAWMASLVHAVGGERRQFEKRRARIDQRHDPVARQKLAARQVTLARPRRAAFRRCRAARLQFRHQRAHRRLVGAKFR